MKHNNPFNRKWRYVTLLVLLAVLAALKWCGNSGSVAPPETTDLADTVHTADTATVATLKGHKHSLTDLLRITMPAAVAVVAHKEYKGYETYYSLKHNVPLATIYHLTKGELYGKASRDNSQFRDDPTVKGCAWYNDYSGSGYSRGHMTPAGDLKWDQQALDESFYMTNVCPQDKDMNENAWGDLELKVREWAKRDKSLIVITGPILSEHMDYIGKRHRVAVPKQFYKIVMANEVQPMRAIGFIYDNRPGDTAPISKHAVSVDSIEARTGLDFFAGLPLDVQDKLESDINIDKWLY